jgi:hypothetical protein
MEEENFQEIQLRSPITLQENPSRKNSSGLLKKLQIVASAGLLIGSAVLFAYAFKEGCSDIAKTYKNLPQTIYKKLFYNPLN